MQAPSWISLFKLIPSHLHDTLALITTTSIEVMVQRVLRVEQDYLVFRGRMSGTMDAGRVMIMPYDQISNVAFNKRMAEEEVDVIFSNSGGWIPEYVADKSRDRFSEDTLSDVASAEEKKETAPAPAVAPPAPVIEPAQPQSAAGSAAKPEHASKSILLARLRARLSGNVKK